jgi:hypothetical protein
MIGMRLFWAVTQCKREITKCQIDRDYPHQVAILVRGTGLIGRSMAMYAWRDSDGLPYRTRSDQRRESADYVRFCLAEPAHIEAFTVEGWLSRLS